MSEFRVVFYNEESRTHSTPFFFKAQDLSAAEEIIKKQFPDTFYGANITQPGTTNFCCFAVKEYYMQDEAAFQAEMEKERRKERY